MQQGVILQASKEAGIIVGMGQWPLGIFVERREPVNIYIRVITDLYARLDDPEKTPLKSGPPDSSKMLGDFLDKLATQVYAGKKWKYLYRDKV